jgi:transposase
MTLDRERALIGIGFIGLFYDAHNAATDASTAITDTVKRRDAAKPIVDKLYQWITLEAPTLVADSPIIDCMNYLVNHREPLSNFLGDGCLRLDNNVSEIELRRQAVGRHNWIFAGSEKVLNRTQPRPA